MTTIFNLKPMLMLMLVLAILYGVIITAPSLHALQTHFNARNVSTRFANYKPPDNNNRDFWSKKCQDGRTYTFRKLASKSGKHAWDVSIDVEDNGTWYNVTKFTCKSAGWIAKKLAWCQVQD